MPPLLTMSELLDGLYRSRMLDNLQIEEILRRPESSNGDINGVQRYVQERGWLTRFQIDEIMAGRGARLMFGNFRLLDKLSESPGGIVYKTFHPSLGKPITLRLVRPEWLLPLDSPDSYLTRIQNVTQLHHPNLLHVLDAGIINGELFTVEEYVDGVDLFYLVNEMGALPSDIASEFVRQAAAGLKEAHDRGIFHGDLSPMNLILSPVLRIPIADATPAPGSIKSTPGSTLKLQGTGQSPNRPPITELTLSQSPFLKSIDFVAPERLSRSDSDMASDIYSLGACFYFLLAARPPFRSANEVEAMWNLQKGTPIPIQELRSDVPTPIARLINAMVSREGWKRPLNLSEVLNALPDPPGSASSQSIFTPTLQSPILSASETDTLPSPKAQLGDQHPPASFPPPPFPDPPRSIPKPIFEPLPSDSGNGFSHDNISVIGLDNSTSASSTGSNRAFRFTDTDSSHDSIPSHGDNHPFGIECAEYHGMGTSGPRRKKVKHSKTWWAWVLAGLILHLSAIVLLVGWFLGWFKSDSNSVPQPTKKQMKPPAKTSPKE